MNLFLWILLFSVLGSLGAILLASFLLLFKDNTQKKILPYLVSFTTGTLLASALLGLIPHALDHVSAFNILGTVLIGILCFFILEKFLLWRHCHDDCCNAAAPMILVGDAFHNFVDGVVITASFFVSVPVGIAVGVSIIAHEIAQETGDFTILLHSGFTRAKAFILNIISGTSTLFGAIIAYFALEKIQEAVPFIMAISAASFLYIALVDLSPELHHETKPKQSFYQFLLMLLGIGVITFLLQFHIH